MEKTCELLPLAGLEAAAECLKVMAHPIRLRIVDILMQGDFPVHEIAEMCELPPHQTCEHLRLLKGHGLLDSERRGRAVYYKIGNPRLPMLLNCIRSTCPAGEERTGIGNSNDEDDAGTRRHGDAGKRPIEK